MRFFAVDGSTLARCYECEGEKEERRGVLSVAYLRVLSVILCEYGCFLTLPPYFTSLVVCVTDMLSFFLGNNGWDRWVQISFIFHSPVRIKPY